MYQEYHQKAAASSSRFSRDPGKLFSQAAEGKITIDIGADAVIDSEGLGNPAVGQYSIVYDETVPSTGTVNDGPGTDIDLQISTVTIQGNWSEFSDALGGISKYEWAIKYVPGLTIVNLKGWTETGLDTLAVDSTLENDKTYFVLVRATDQAGNASSEINGDGVTITQNAPTVEVSSDAVYATNQSTFAVTVVFSTDVTGFDESDVTISNGTLASFTGSGKEYSFEVTPTDEGKVTMDIVLRKPPFSTNSLCDLPASLGTYVVTE